MCATDEVFLSALSRHESAVYEKLRDNFRSSYDPQTEEEKLLVDRIAIEHFRLLRFYRIEHQTYRRTRDAAKLRDTIVPYIDRFSRYEAATSRQLHVLHNNLCHLYYQRGDYRSKYIARRE